MSGVVAVLLLNHILLRYLILLLLLADDEVSSFKYSITSINKNFVLNAVIFSMYLTGMLVQIEGFGSYFEGKPLISVNNYFKNISPLKLQRQKTVLFPILEYFYFLREEIFVMCFATKCTVFPLRREIKHFKSVKKYS